MYQRKCTETLMVKNSPSTWQLMVISRTGLSMNRILLVVIRKSLSSSALIYFIILFLSSYLFTTHGTICFLIWLTRLICSSPFHASKILKLIYGRASTTSFNWLEVDRSSVEYSSMEVQWKHVIIRFGGTAVLTKYELQTHSSTFDNHV